MAQALVYQGVTPGATTMPSNGNREDHIALWVDALRRKADAATLKSLPTLSDADAARVMALLRMDSPPPAEPAPVIEAPTDSVPGHFRPRLTLQTLGRGDGLLGLKPQGKLGPRGDSVTLAQFDWTYTTDAGDRWHTPAPTSILNNRPAGGAGAV